MRYKKREPYKNDYDLELISNMMQAGLEITDIEEALGYGKNALRYYIKRNCEIITKVEVVYKKKTKALREEILNHIEAQRKL